MRPCDCAANPSENIRALRPGRYLRLRFTGGSGSTAGTFPVVGYARSGSGRGARQASLVLVQRRTVCAVNARWASLADTRLTRAPLAHA